MYFYSSLLGTLTAVVTFIVIRWGWHWYKAETYSKKTLISDAWLAGASGTAVVFVSEILPLLEQLCLTAGQQDAIKVFGIIPALIVALCCAGLLFSPDLDDVKIVASMLIFGILTLASVRVVINTEPCQVSEITTLWEVPDLDLWELILTLGFGVGLVASSITIVEHVREKRQSHKAKKDNERIGSNEP